jgi:ribonuclease HI
MRRRYTLDGAVEPIPGDLIIAADAAISAETGCIGLAHVATDGTWAMRLRTVKPVLADNAVYELYAVYYALHKRGLGAPITVLTDSQDAVKFLTSWRNGEEIFPAEYRRHRPLFYQPENVPQPRLEDFAVLVAAHPEITYLWQPGHIGHPLNECADSLAKLAMRMGTDNVQPADISALPPQWARARLGDYKARGDKA